MFECETCTDRFYYQDDCSEHMDDFNHWPECEVCPRQFRTQSACNQHMNDTDHWPECETCPQQFRTQSACNQHMNDTKHWPECETCPRTFRTQRACDQHMNDTDHWEPEFPCETCDSVYRSQAAANQHMKDKGHYKNYCQECNRRFQSESNLRTHLNSRLHRGSPMSCPFCKGSYTSASGVTHHLETGSCKKAPKLNRETISKLIREKDQNGLITPKQLTWTDDSNVTYHATDRAWNGDFWECYMCHRCFNHSRALNQHLNSPVHKQKVYHCPNRRCGKEFVALAGLFNHLESEACAFMRFEKVQKQMKNVLSGNKLLTFG